MLSNLFWLIKLEFNRSKAGVYILTTAIITTLLIRIYWIGIRTISVDNIHDISIVFQSIWNVVFAIILASIFLGSLREDFNSRVWHGFLVFPISSMEYVVSRWFVMLFSVLIGSAIPSLVSIVIWKLPLSLLWVNMGGVINLAVYLLIIAPLFNVSFIGEGIITIYTLLSMFANSFSVEGYFYWFPIEALFTGKILWQYLVGVIALLVFSLFIFTLNKWRYVS